jgi:hypothetical protein
MLRNSKTLKIKHNWSRDTSAEFIKDDIKEAHLNNDKTITLSFNWPHTQTFNTKDFNLRETEELINYLEENEIRDDIVKKEMMLKKIRGNFGRDAA